MMKLYDVLNSRSTPGGDTIEWGNHSAATMSEFEAGHTTLSGVHSTTSLVDGLNDSAREGLSLLSPIAPEGGLAYLPKSTRMIVSGWNGTSVGLKKVCCDSRGSGTATLGTLGLTSMPSFNTSTGVDFKTLPWTGRLSTQWVSRGMGKLDHHRTDLRVSGGGLVGESVYGLGPEVSLLSSVTTDWKTLTGARVGARFGDVATGMVQGSVSFDSTGTGVTFSGSHRLSNTLRVGGTVMVVPTGAGERADPSVKMVYQPARGLKLSAMANTSSLTAKGDVAVTDSAAVSLFHRRQRDGTSSSGFGFSFGGSGGGVVGSLSVVQSLVGLTE